MHLEHDLVITCCASAHADAVSQLLQHAVAAALTGESSERIEAAAAAYSKEQIIRGMTGRLTYVAVSHHKIIGAILVSTSDEQGTFIEALCVEPEHHNQGVGELLIQTAESRAGELGVKRLQVSNQLFASAGFFEKHGYKSVDQLSALSKALA